MDVSHTTQHAERTKGDELFICRQVAGTLALDTMSMSSKRKPSTSASNRCRNVSDPLRMDQVVTAGPGMSERSRLNCLSRMRYISPSVGLQHRAIAHR
jgi:hypothetical protein